MQGGGSEGTGLYADFFSCTYIPTMLFDYKHFYISTKEFDANKNFP